MTRIFIAFMFIVVVVAHALSCKSDADKPLTVVEHARAAEVHEARAEQHDAAYDPDAYAYRFIPQSVDLPAPVYNPTARHRIAAEKHRREADEHMAAAEELAEIEDEACAPFGENTRAMCPVLGSLTNVEEIEGGARVTLANPAEREALLWHIRCHVAFRSAHGAQIEHCPIYVPNVQAEADGDAIVFKTDDEHVDELVSLLRTHLD